MIARHFKIAQAAAVDLEVVVELIAPLTQIPVDQCQKVAVVLNQAWVAGNMENDKALSLSLACRSMLLLAVLRLEVNTVL